MPMEMPDCKLDLSSVLAEVKLALIKFGENPPADPMIISILLPVVAGSGDDFMKDRRGSALRHTGWRGLVRDGHQRPVASIDVFPGEGREQPSIAVRGSEAAEAMAKVVTAADTLAQPSRESMQAVFLNLPSLFVTAIWLQGKEDHFIPTRIDEGLRPGVEIYAEARFRALVSERLDAVKRAVLPEEP